MIFVKVYAFNQKVLTMKKIIMLCCFILSNHLQAQSFVTVGTDNNCDYSAASLQTAINNNAAVRVTNQTIYAPISLINRSVELIGGYNNCHDAQNNISSAVLTEISGNNSMTAIQIKTTAASGHNPKTVVFKGLDIHSGLTNGSNIAGGVVIIGNVDTSISHSTIRNNSANHFGGGLYYSGINGGQLLIDHVEIKNNSAGSNGGGLFVSQNAQVTIKHSTLEQNTAVSGGGIAAESGAQLQSINTQLVANTAQQTGGGITCLHTTLVDIDDNSYIANNHSAVSGGGIYAGNGCQVKLRAGDNLSVPQSIAGLNNNSATNFGGGAYLLNAQLIVLGNAFHFANVIGNYTTDENNGQGGGIYARGSGSQVKITNGRINHNQANRGSALSLNEGAHLHMRRSSGSCFGNQLCSEVANNAADFSATIMLNSCATTQIYQTTFRDNTAAIASVLDLNGDHQNSCESIFEGNQVFGNQAEQSTGYSLFKLDNQVTFNFAFNTVTDNATDHIFVLGAAQNSTQSLKLNSSLIWNDPANVISAGSPNHHYSGQCFNVPAPHALPDSMGPMITANDPGFADSVTHDYALTLFSAPLDYCDTSVYQPKHHDIKGIPRGFAIVAPVYGHYDMGAFEFNNINQNDVIFYDHFD